MKTLIQWFLMMCMAGTVSSQTDLYLKINHKLDTSLFAFNSNKTNNLGNSLNVTRLDYYLTVVSVMHDGGTVTPINKTLLVHANIPLNDSLGNYGITNIEKITLAVGVDSSLNHLDPSLYPASSPLAPKSPSMHWGWAPGYRFVAMEGLGGTTSPPNQNYELHALGDHNYHYTTVATSGVSSVGKKTIELNANYVEALHNINISTGLLEHGETAATRKLLENFKLRVFTSIEGNPSVGVEDISLKPLNLIVSPNPIKQGEPMTISVDRVIEKGTLTITDVTGKMVREIPLTKNAVRVEELSAGTYAVSVKSKGKLLVVRKVIVTNN